MATVPARAVSWSGVQNILDNLASRRQSVDTVLIVQSRNMQGGGNEVRNIRALAASRPGQQHRGSKQFWGDVLEIHPALPGRTDATNKQGGLNVIDKPYLKSKTRIITETVLTAGLWGAFLYCMLPAIRALVALAWPGLATVPVVLGSLSGTIWDLLGGGAFPATAPSFMGLVLLTGQIAFAVLALYTLWICYNHLILRFKQPGEAFRLLTGRFPDASLEDRPEVKTIRRRRSSRRAKPAANACDQVENSAPAGIAYGPAAQHATEQPMGAPAQAAPSAQQSGRTVKAPRPQRKGRAKPPSIDERLGQAPVFTPAPQPVNGSAPCVA